MNYIEQINAFWMAHQEHGFTPTDQALYFNLLDVNNKMRWKNPFKANATMLAGRVGVSKKTYEKSRDNLKEAGIIDYKTVFGSANTTFQLLDLGNIYGGGYGGVSVGNGASTEGGRYTGNNRLNINEKETKQNIILYRAFAHLKIYDYEIKQLTDIGYSKAEIDGVLDQIENYAENKKYTSLFVTAKTWLKNKKVSAAPVLQSESLSIKEEKKKIDKSVEAFEAYKKHGSVTDWDSEIFDYLVKKQVVEVDSGAMMKMAGAGKLTEAKQSALMEFFSQLAEEGRELKELLK